MMLQLSIIFMCVCVHVVGAHYDTHTEASRWSCSWMYTLFHWQLVPSIVLRLQRHTKDTKFLGRDQGDWVTQKKVGLSPRLYVLSRNRYELRILDMVGWHVIHARSLKAYWTLNEHSLYYGSGFSIRSVFYISTQNTPQIHFSWLFRKHTATIPHS